MAYFTAVEITDGTNTASVKAASTPAAATDTSLIIQLNPEQPALTTPLNVSAAISSGTITTVSTVSTITNPVTVQQSTAANLNATVVGTLTNNNAAPTTTNLGVLPALANATVPSWTEGNQVLLSTDLVGRVRTLATVTGGSVPAGTQSTDNPALIGGVYGGSYNSLLPTLASNQVGQFQVDVNGNLKVSEGLISQILSSWTPSVLTQVTTTAVSPTLSVTVNPATNNVYFPNNGSNVLGIVNGTTLAFSTLTLTSISSSITSTIAINSSTNTIFVAGATVGGAAVLAIINGNTLGITYVTLAASNFVPRVISLNKTTNTIFIGGNGASGGLYAYNVSTATLTFVTSGGNSPAIAINEITNTIYYGSSSASALTVVNGVTLATNSVSTSHAIATIAVNPITNIIYATGSTALYVINGSNNLILNTLTLTNTTTILGVNPSTNTIYAAGLNDINIISGVSLAVTVVGTSVLPLSIAINQNTNQIFFGNNGSTTVSVIDGNTATLSNITIAASGSAYLSVNSNTNQVFVSNTSAASITVINPATTTSILASNVGSPAILTQLDQNSSVTGGAVTWQGSYDGINWVTIPAQQVVDPTSSTFAQISNPYSFVASTNKPFLILMGGYQQIRANLTSALTGTGASVTAYVTALPYLPFEYTSLSGVVEVAPTGSANTLSNPFFNVLADNSGHALTVNSTTTASKFAPDQNIISILGTAPTTAGFIDIKGADGNVFVRQTTGTNLHVVTDSTSTTAVTQATGTNLHAVVDSGTITTVSTVTAVTTVTNPVKIEGNGGATLDAAINTTAPTNAVWTTNAPATAAAAALTPVSIAATAQKVLKASAGNLYGLFLLNLAEVTTTSTVEVMYIHFFNTTTTTSLATSSWLFNLPIPASTTGSLGNTGQANPLCIPPGLLALANFTSGIVIVINTTSASNTTASGTAPVGVVWVE